MIQAPVRSQNRFHATNQQTVQNAGAMGLNSWRFQPRLMPVPHRHSDIEINFLLAGSITYLHRERTVSISSGRLAVFWGAIPHQLTERPDECDMCILTIPLELFLAWKLPNTLTQPLLAGELLVDQNHEESQIDRLLFPRWNQDMAVERGAIALKEIEARLWRFALGTKTPKSSSKGGQTKNKENEMARYIVDHYAEPLTVQQVADSASLHPSYAMSCFKTTFGMTILEYILQYRIAQAQRLLATTDESVLDVALQSGFNSISSFYAAFKKYVGSPPNCYRRSVL